MHTGYDPNSPDHMHCRPKQILSVMQNFPGLTLIAAHMGGIDCEQDVLDKLCGRDIWFDLSMGYAMMPKPVAQRIVDKHTPDRLLFASDMPWHRPAWELRLINSLDLSEEDREKIFWKNGAKLLKL